MKGHEGKTLHHCAWAVLLLGACSKAPESPVAKTNPNPKQRYEITVELVDPPQDIREISGVAHFGGPHKDLPSLQREDCPRHDWRQLQKGIRPHSRGREHL